MNEITNSIQTRKGWTLEIWYNNNNNIMFITYLVLMYGTSGIVNNEILYILSNSFTHVN